MATDEDDVRVEIATSDESESTTIEINSDVVAIVIRKETAIDLLNALTVALGGYAESAEAPEDEASFDLAGDHTIRPPR